MSDHELCPYCGCRPCSELHACPGWHTEYEQIMERADILTRPPMTTRHADRIYRTSSSRRSAIPRAPKE